MTLSLDELRKISQERTGTVLQSQYTSQTINPPTWVSLIQVASGVSVSLNAPTQDNGQAYLAQSAGLTFGAASTQNPIFFYHVQLDDNVAFSSPVLYDLATSTSKTISGVFGTLYARARARMANGPWSAWKPYSTTVASSPLLLPLDFTTTLIAGGTATSMYRAMDGSTDTATYCDINTFAAATDQAFFNIGPFPSTNLQTAPAANLNIKTGVPTNNIGAAVTCFYSFDGAETLSTAFTTSTTRATTTDTVAISGRINLGLTRVNFVVNGGVGVGTCNLRVYEVSLTVTG